MKAALTDDVAGRATSASPDASDERLPWKGKREMPEFPPDPARAGVVAVASEPDGEDGRAFAYEGGPPDDAGDLPDLDDLAHEEELVNAMMELGYRLTMVGGGAGSGERRRFYFRKKEGEGEAG